MKNLFLKYSNAVLLMNGINQVSHQKHKVNTLIKNLKNSLTIEILLEDKFNIHSKNKLKYKEVGNTLLKTYSEFEPEHSRRYSPIDLVVRYPQLFGNPLETSLISSDQSIDVAILFQNQESKQSLVQKLRQQREIKNFPQIKIFSLEQFYQSSVPIQQFPQQQHNLIQQKKEDSNTSDIDIFHYDVSCLGGTFDRLHLGHRILLSACAYLTKSKVIIGITSEQLLRKKDHKAFIESYENRMKMVKSFVNRINPNLKIQFHPLHDPVGIAGQTSQPQALFMTRETEKGGIYVNEVRVKRNLKPMELVFADMVFDEADVEEQKSKQFSGKTSSSKIRKYLDYQAGRKGSFIYDEWNKLLLQDMKVENYDLSYKWWNNLMNYYSQPWRFYHTLRHIGDIISWIHSTFNSDNTMTVEEKVILQLSAYFHDIIYTPNRPDNEVLSVEKFEQFWDDVKGDQKLIGKCKGSQIREVVKTIIESTIKHFPLMKKDEQQFYYTGLQFLDADLSILGSSEQQYLAYTKWVWKQYEFYGRSNFNSGRQKIMSGFLQRQRLYFTQEGYKSLEERARTNIQNEIKSIQADLQIKI